MEGKASGNAEVDEQCRNLKKEIYQRWESNILQRSLGTGGAADTAVSGPSSGFVPVGRRPNRRSPATVAPADGAAGRLPNKPTATAAAW